jgi:hypothetical protein
MSKRDKRGGKSRREWTVDHVRINGEKPKELAKVVKPTPAELRQLRAEIERRAKGG